MNSSIQWHVRLRDVDGTEARGLHARRRSPPRGALYIPGERLTLGAERAQVRFGGATCATVTPCSPASSRQSFGPAASPCCARRWTRCTGRPARRWESGATTRSRKTEKCAARIGARGVQPCHVTEWVCEVPGLLRQRARAHALIYDARRAGNGPTAAEMQPFARELLLLARQCGVAWLSHPSREDCEINVDASRPARGRVQFRRYAGLAHLLGRTIPGKLSQRVDRVRW
jgi:hypothetical protein